MERTAWCGCAAATSAVSLPAMAMRERVALLWDGFVGESLTRGRVVVELGGARKLALSRLDDWLPMAADRPLIEGVRMALAALPEDSPASSIAATLPVAVAALLRTRQGKSPVTPDAMLVTAADFLRISMASRSRKSL